MNNKENKWGGEETQVFLVSPLILPDLFGKDLLEANRIFQTSETVREI